MRLLSLTIDRYKMLRDLTLNLDRSNRLEMGSYALDFLVGLNGSGKSTLLRALAQIVADLHANRPTAFDYRLEYLLSPPSGEVRVIVERVEPTVIMRVYRLEDTEPFYNEIVVDAQYLPQQVVVYTTGTLSSWDELVSKMEKPARDETTDDEILRDPIQRAIVELPGHPPPQVEAVDTVQSPLLILRESRLPLMTLTGLLTASKFKVNPLAEVLQSLRLRRLCGFSLRFRLHSALSDYDLFDHIRGVATRHIQQGSDHLLVFDMPQGRGEQQAFVKQLWQDYADPLDFFSAANRLCEPIETGEPTLQEVNLFLERELAETEDEEDVTRLLLFDWLSDGEQSFFGRMAMLTMLQTNNSLILLDEPEVHFNDYWKREIVLLIDRVMSKHTNHLLIVSHSSIGLSDVSADQISVLSQSEDGFTNVQPPQLKTFGTDPSEIMIVIFHTNVSTGAYATRILESAVESADYARIASFLNKVGPGMWLFQLRRRLEAIDAVPD